LTLKILLLYKFPEALLSSTCHERSPSFNDYVTRQEFSHSFFTSVLSKPSFESGASSFLVDDSNQFLLQASPSLLHQLALSVDWSAGAQTAYSAQTFPLLLTLALTLMFGL